MYINFLHSKVRQVLGNERYTPPLQYFTTGIPTGHSLQPLFILYDHRTILRLINSLKNVWCPDYSAPLLELTGNAWESPYFWSHGFMAKYAIFVVIVPATIFACISIHLNHSTVRAMLPIVQCIVWITCIMITITTVRNSANLNDLRDCHCHNIIHVQHNVLHYILFILLYTALYLQIWACCLFTEVNSTVAKCITVLYVTAQQTHYDLSVFIV